MSELTTAASRLVSSDLLAEQVEPVGLPTPLRIAEKVFGVELDREVGVWEAGPGSDVDTEIDEVFLVLAGIGAVSFADGSTINLRRGVLVQLRAGDRTTWVITERLRKLYIA